MLRQLRIKTGGGGGGGGGAVPRGARPGARSYTATVDLLSLCLMVACGAWTAAGCICE
jgi:hypothetical protein